PNLSPDTPLGILLDQVIAISHDEVHCQSPRTRRALAHSLLIFARKIGADARISLCLAFDRINPQSASRWQCAWRYRYTGRWTSRIDAIRQALEPTRTAGLMSGRSL